MVAERTAPQPRLRLGEPPRRGLSLGRRLAFALLSCLACLLPCLPACGLLRSYQPPLAPVYAPTDPPRLSLAEKARRMEASFRAHNRTPEGLVDYERPKAPRPPHEPRYGRYSDGPFHGGIALAAFSLRFAATGDAASLDDVRKALEGLELLEAVTGKPGLLARYASLDPAPFDPRFMHPRDGRRARPPLDRYVYRGDVSKDQYAGVAYGLTTCLALVSEPSVRTRAAALARRIVTGLQRDGETLVDEEGRETTFGSLRVHYGPVRIALHAAILLALARAAATDGQGDAYHQALVAGGAPDAVAGGIFNATILTVRNHVNDNMAHLALFALFRLETDEAVLRKYRKGLEMEWAEIADEENPFFDLVYAACGGRHAERARERARRRLRDFPDEKRRLPVDWTRPGEASDALLRASQARLPESERILSPALYGRRFVNSRRHWPRADRVLPIYLRPLGTMAWVSDPDVLCGNEGEADEWWLSPLDYLEAYWLGRWSGAVGAEE